MNLLKSGFSKVPKDYMSLSEEWLQVRAYRIKKSTLCKYENLIQLYIAQYFQGISVKQITSPLINQKMMELYNENKERLAYSTFRSIFYLIRAITTYGVSMGYYSQVYINFEIVDHTGNKEIQVLNDSQEQRIIHKVLETQSANHLGILLSLCTGLRLGEVCALTVEDIDLFNRVINVRKTVQRISEKEHRATHLTLTEPKSKHSKRTIPLSDFLYNILVSYHINEYEKGCFILTKTTIPFEPRTLQYAFKRITKECGYDNLHFHCLRHTFATKCVRLGFDIKMVSEMLGHANVSFTLNRYVHPNLEAKKAKMQILDQCWASLSA